MPTPTGLPKTGEVWELRVKLPGREVEPQRIVVLSRSRGDYWALRVATRKGGRWSTHLWVDATAHLKYGWLRYIGDAGPNTRRELRSIGWLA